MLLHAFNATRTLRNFALRLAVPLALSWPALAAAQTVTFEPLTYGSACSWGGSPTPFATYAGFSWVGLRSLDLTNLANSCGRTTNSGYVNLLASNVGNVVALGSGAAAMTSTTPFVLSSLVAGAGWLDPTKLRLDYYLEGVFQATTTLNLFTNETGSNPFTVSGGTRNVLYGGATDWIIFTPDYSGAADTFNTAAESCFGAPAGCVPEAYKAYYLDNLMFKPAAMVIDVVPEPATLALTAAGLLALAGFARKRARGRGTAA